MHTIYPDLLLAVTSMATHVVQVGISMKHMFATGGKDSVAACGDPSRNQGKHSEVGSGSAPLGNPILGRGTITPQHRSGPEDLETRTNMRQDTTQTARREGSNQAGLVAARQRQTSL